MILRAVCVFSPNHVGEKYSKRIQLVIFISVTSICRLLCRYLVCTSSRGNCLVCCPQISLLFAWFDLPRCANPAYTAGELTYQLSVTNALILLTHPDNLTTALVAARQAGIAADHIFLMDELRVKTPIPFPTVSDLVKEGLSKPDSFSERKLSAGEGKTKIAFFSFSSGTTGKPKVLRLSYLWRNL